ncbi:transposase, MuDR, MULE transposase domain protein [Tanacetum coccineum]|uniref:Transposase, MuDR, MULE transposase domain protein n=1 Tax=Tanacetum coccineum TaxID=301880 RepID=A0ABQ5AP56_9ASTR
MEEQTMGKAREEKIRAKKADDEILLWNLGGMRIDSDFESHQDNTGVAVLISEPRLLKKDVLILDTGWALDVDTRIYAEKLLRMWVRMQFLAVGLPGTIHYKVLDVGSYENDITVGAAMTLVNVLVFTSKPSKHYHNITKRNVVEVFRKDTVSLA